jgi:hypothetical protein
LEKVFFCAIYSGPFPGCQMAYFQTQNPNLGRFWRALQWKMLMYFMAYWSIEGPFVILCGQLLNFVAIWYIFPFWYVVRRKIWQPWSLLRSAGDSRRCSLDLTNLEPILRLWNLQLQHLRCMYVGWFLKVEGYFFVFKTQLVYLWSCKFLQRWRCNSRS